jgi:ketosteroid isomerase-like protein
MPNGHLVKGYHDFKKLHENWFDDHDWTMKKEILSINKSESTGTCLAKVHYIDLDEDGKRYEIDYYLFLLFMKCDGKWLLIHDQNTLIK